MVGGVQFRPQNDSDHLLLPKNPRTGDRATVVGQGLGLYDLVIPVLVACKILYDLTHALEGRSWNENPSNPVVYKPSRHLPRAVACHAPDHDLTLLDLRDRLAAEPW